MFGIKKMLLAGALLAASTISASAAHFSVFVGPGYYGPPPPVVYRSYYAAPYAPGPGYYWTDGYWDYPYGRRVWVPGYWGRRSYYGRGYGYGPSYGYRGYYGRSYRRSYWR